MVNTSLKKLKHHLAGFDVVVKERTTPTTITEGSWGFEHTKACFRDEIILFVKALKDLFNTFNQYLVDELFEVQNVFHQMEQTVEQHRLESKTFEFKMTQVLNENERLLEQVISKYIVNILVKSSVNIASVNVHECEKCLKLETELLNKKDFVEKEIYNKLFKSFTTLEKHCISLEVDTQHNQEMLRESSDFSEESVEKSWGKETANEIGSKFILCFYSSFVEFVQPCFCFPGSVLALPSNWFHLTRVKWLPLIANSLAVSGIVIAEPGVGATTWSAAYMGSSSIG
ncbi:hypothetical protein Tco_1228737 [Tanacetum coccineum]